LHECTRYCLNGAGQSQYSKVQCGPDTSPKRETGHTPGDKEVTPSQNRDTGTRLSRGMPSGVPLLSSPQLNLTIARPLPGRAFVIRYGDRTLPVRRGAQSVTWRGPKVKRGGVQRDLYYGMWIFTRKDFVVEEEIYGLQGD